MKKILFVILVLFSFSSLWAQGTIIPRPSSSTGTADTTFVPSPDEYVCGNQYSVSAKPYYAAADIQKAVNDALSDGIKKVKVTSDITLASVVILADGVDIDAEGHVLTCGLKDNNSKVVSTIRARTIVGISGQPAIKIQKNTTVLKIYSDCVGGASSNGITMYSGTLYAVGNMTGVYGFFASVSTTLNAVINGNCIGLSQNGVYSDAPSPSSAYVTVYGDCSGAADGVICGGGTQVIHGNCSSTSGGGGARVASNAAFQTIYGDCTGLNGGAYGSYCSQGKQVIYGNVVGYKYGAYNHDGTLIFLGKKIQVLDGVSHGNDPGYALQVDKWDQLTEIAAGTVLLNEGVSGYSIHTGGGLHEYVTLLGVCLANLAQEPGTLILVGSLTVSADIQPF